MPVSTSDVVDYLTKKAEIDGLTWNVHDNSIAKYNSNSIYVEKKHVISTPVAPLSHVKEHVFLVRVNDVDINRVLDYLRGWFTITWELLNETFESGTTKFTLTHGEITTEKAFRGIYGLKLDAIVGEDAYAKYIQDGMQPTHVECRIYPQGAPSGETSNCPFFVDSTGTKWWGIIFNCQGRVLFYDGSSNTDLAGYTRYTWHWIRVTNMDWTNQTCNVYLDGTQIGNSLSFSPSNMTSCRRIEIKHDMPGTEPFYYDDFFATELEWMDEPADFLKSPQISSEYKGANQWDITFKVIEIG